MAHVSNCTHDNWNRQCLQTVLWWVHLFLLVDHHSSVVTKTLETPSVQTCVGKSSIAHSKCKHSLSPLVCPLLLAMQDKKMMTQQMWFQVCTQNSLFFACAPSRGHNNEGIEDWKLQSDWASVFGTPAVVLTVICEPNAGGNPLWKDRF